MATDSATENPTRPSRVVHEPLPTIPDVTGKSEAKASTEYSHYRTGLSHHRTELSEHRTDLSEYRTDLSTHRTDLSIHRTDMSTNRTEMAMRRTGMAIHRTRMAADRTMMAEIRTSLSLIGFGFTISQAFQRLHEAGTIANAEAPRNFGAALIVLGIMIIAGGIWRHVQFATELRRTRERMTDKGLIHGESVYPISVSLIVSVLLLLVGLAAILSIAIG